jgi:hypothetical protein
MRRPINKLKDLEDYEFSKEESSKLAELRKMHELNIKTQQKLKSTPSFYFRGPR